MPFELVSTRTRAGTNNAYEEISHFDYILAPTAGTSVYFDFVRRKLRDSRPILPIETSDSLDVILNTIDLLYQIDMTPGAADDFIGITIGDEYTQVLPQSGPSSLGVKRLFTNLIILGYTAAEFNNVPIEITGLPDTGHVWPVPDVNYWFYSGSAHRFAPFSHTKPSINGDYLTLSHVQPSPLLSNASVFRSTPREYDNMGPFGATGSIKPSRIRPQWHYHANADGTFDWYRSEYLNYGVNTLAAAGYGLPPTATVFYYALRGASDTGDREVSLTIFARDKDFNSLGSTVIAGPFTATRTEVSGVTYWTLEQAVSLNNSMLPADAVYYVLDLSFAGSGNPSVQRSDVVYPRPPSIWPHACAEPFFGTGQMGLGYMRRIAASVGS